jgi:hypothetical protein
MWIFGPIFCGQDMLEVPIVASIICVFETSQDKLNFVDFC